MSTLFPFLYSSAFSPLQSEKKTGKGTRNLKSPSLQDYDNQIYCFHKYINRYLNICLSYLSRRFLHMLNLSAFSLFSSIHPYRSSFCVLLRLCQRCLQLFLFSMQRCQLFQVTLDDELSVCKVRPQGVSIFSQGKSLLMVVGHTVQKKKSQIIE